MSAVVKRFYEVIQGHYFWYQLVCHSAPSITTTF